MKEEPRLDWDDKERKWKKTKGEPMKKIDLFADIFEAITEISAALGQQVAEHVRNDNKVQAYMAYGGLVALHDLMEVIHQSLTESEPKPHDTILDPNASLKKGG